MKKIAASRNYRITKGAQAHYPGTPDQQRGLASTVNLPLSEQGDMWQQWVWFLRDVETKLYERFHQARANPRALSPKSKKYCDRSLDGSRLSKGMHCGWDHESEEYAPSESEMRKATKIMEDIRTSMADLKGILDPVKFRKKRSNPPEDLIRMVDEGTYKENWE